MTKCTQHCSNVANSPTRGLCYPHFYASRSAYITRKHIMELSDLPDTTEQLDEYVAFVVEKWSSERWHSHAAITEPGLWRLNSDNVTKILQMAFRRVLERQEQEHAKRDRQGRLDEHTILAGLDEEGRKRRYLELAAAGGD